MNAQQLKNAILQEAIEGRLVPQDPNDEPASVLLERIRKEKARLVKEKKIILSKPEKACIIKEDGEFSLPQSWEWGMINAVCRVFGRIGFRGYTKNDLRYSQENAAISISPSNMINGTMDFSNCTYISEEKYEESPEIKIQNGDILIVKTGSSYGKSSLVENLPWKSTINPQIAVVKDIKINKHFLVYFFQSPYAQSKFKNFVLGTSIPTFSQLNLISMQIPLPPLAEQKRIVAKIEELLPKVEEYGKAQDALNKLNAELPERLKKSILQEAISGRLVPQDPNDEPASVLLANIRKEKARMVKEGKLKKKDLEETPIEENEIPFKIPECWEWVRLKSLVSVLGDGIHGTPEYDITGDYYFINGNNLSNNKIVIKADTKKVNEKEYQIHKKELNDKTILVSINGTIGNVGHYNGEPVILGKSACYYNLMDLSLKSYITMLMYTDYFLKYAVENATGSTIKNVSLAVMNDFLVPFPPLAEQQRIVEKLEQLLGEIDKLKK